MSIHTELHTFKVRDFLYKIRTNKIEEDAFDLLNDSNLTITQIYGSISTCLEPPQWRFAAAGPIWKFAPIDQIAIRDAITYLEIRYNTLQ